MFDFLDQLRHKPLQYRQRVAVLATCGFTALIVIIWLSTLSFDSAGVVDQNALQKDFQPFEEIKKGVGDFYDNVKIMSSGIFDIATTSPAPNLEPLPH